MYTAHSYAVLKGQEFAQALEANRGAHVSPSLAPVYIYIQTHSFFVICMQVEVNVCEQAIPNRLTCIYIYVCISLLCRHNHAARDCTCGWSAAGRRWSVRTRNRGSLLIIDCSTMDPVASRQLNSEVRMIDAPVWTCSVYIYNKC
jgi:hypothetical protein